MRVHLLTLPNALPLWSYDLDGFNTMNLRFAKLLKGLGHEVILYGVGDHTDAQCDQFVGIMTLDEYKAVLGNNQYQHAIIEAHTPWWQLANPRLADEIKARKQPRDIICSIGGGSQQSVSMANPDVPTIEYSIGYIGSWSPYRIFQSQAWRHQTYGRFQMDEVRFFDEVIHGFFEAEKFPVNKPEDYFVYVGRFTPRKGIKIVCDVAKIAGVNVKFIGHGAKELITYGECLGPLPELERNEVVSKARALICPTCYVEPYGCISPEAQLSGVPVISTDVGGFTETVVQGVTGYRCNLFGQFVDAISKVDALDRKQIREIALSRYSLEAAAPQYESYFRRFNTLWDQGWHTNPYALQ